jgi:hypothetical protein
MRGRGHRRENILLRGTGYLRTWGLRKEQGVYEERFEAQPKGFKVQETAQPSKRSHSRTRGRTLRFPFDCDIGTDQKYPSGSRGLNKSNAVKSTTTHGRGLSAARDVIAGELILCEAALCLPNLYHGEEGSDPIMYNLNTTSRTQRTAQAVLFLKLDQKLYKNPHLNKSFCDLDGGRHTCGLGRKESWSMECQQLIRNLHTRRLTTCVLANT